jgi:acyl-CoA thioesterase-1
MKLITFLVCFHIAIIAQTNILFLGDSLTAGFQLSEKEAFPYQLEVIIGSQNMTSINRGLSGDTSYSLLNRLDFSLKPTPDIVFLCIGANDGLRGMNLNQTSENIIKIIQTLHKKEINVILAGMTLPDNYSIEYVRKFESMFPKISKSTNVPLMPFLLKNVAAVPSLNLTDGIHPNSAGHQVIAKSIFQFLQQEQLISTRNQWNNTNFKNY